MDCGVQLMDTSDIAAAALHPDGRGKCNCSRETKTRKPNPRCVKCNGSGIVTACEDCEGSGWKANQNKICPRCQGRGYMSGEPTRRSRRL
jgi:DnaJ-class molecular chaperone